MEDHDRSFDPCETKPLSRAPVYIHEDTLRKIKERPRYKSRTETERWMAIYMLLFPDDKIPQSPCQLKCCAHQGNLKRRLMITDHQTSVYLESRNAIGNFKQELLKSVSEELNNLPNQQTMEVAGIPDFVHRCINSALRRYPISEDLTEHTTSPCEPSECSYSIAPTGSGRAAGSQTPILPLNPCILLSDDLVSIPDPWSSARFLGGSGSYLIPRLVDDGFPEAFLGPDVTGPVA